ncbi:neurogenic locus notch homolog protein 1 [Nematostella vectensis]|uniref:neurogenic locus notch homolog protein 1 n=1 Tax=Nematostella vectensis TaxID=45351 RepID=UPI00138FF41C|nr:neurogenic locus notch homolog protein 1 [Nematostella vectensis]
MLKPILICLAFAAFAIRGVLSLCDPYTQCFGHGDYNAATQTCKCYTAAVINVHWGPYTGECCESIGCTNPNSTCKHGACAIDGTSCERCQTGWTGANCDNVTACFPWLACAHGRCTKSRFRCECDPGWHGDLCDRAMCNVPCHFGACPHDPNKCECYSNYYSPETGCDRAYCAPDWKCLNNGFCVDSRHCKCPDHYTGPHCEFISNCSVPCSHGRCTTAPDKCECEKYWSGADCGTYIGTCNNCSSVGGTCSAGPDTCACRPGYTGPTCAVQKCDGCGHGSCQISAGKKSCTCDYGWLNNVGDASFTPGRGPCTKIWKCTEPCVYGTCPSDPFKCECRAPYTGTQCDTIKCPECCPPETCDCSSGHQSCRPDWHHDCCLVKSCFHGNTLVHTARGLVPIREVRVGDLVVTRHEGDSPEVTHLRRVDQVRKKLVQPKDLVVLRVNDEDIWVTYNHPLYVQATKSWVAAVNITTADALQAVKGGSARLQSKQQANELLAASSDSEGIPVYDLAVREYDRYAVGRGGIMASSCDSPVTLQTRDKQIWGAMARPQFSFERGMTASAEERKEKEAGGSAKDPETSGSAGLIAGCVVAGACLVAILALALNKYRKRQPYKGLDGDYLVAESPRRYAGVGGRM